MAVLIISLPMVLAEEYRLLYDTNGNLIYDQETDIYREYNELNQLIRTRINNASGTILQEYVWDPIKEEIFIKDEFYSNGSLKSSTYYFRMDYIVLQNSSGTYNRTNIYQDGVFVGYEDFDGKKRYVLPDHEGSAHIILNESGNIIEENLFSPFGEPLQGVIENKFSYEAKEYDSLVKDYDFHFRKYDPKLRIFTQPDTLIQNVYDPQLLNRYSFERNNPYKHTDPNGHQLYYLLLAIPIAILISMVYNVFITDETKKEDLAESGSSGSASEAIGQSAENIAGKPAGFGAGIIFDFFMEMPFVGSDYDSCKTPEDCYQEPIVPKTEKMGEDLRCAVISWCPSKLKYELPTTSSIQEADSQKNVNTVSTSFNTQSNIVNLGSYYNIVTSSGTYSTTNPLWQS